MDINKAFNFRNFKSNISSKDEIDLETVIAFLLRNKIIISSISIISFILFYLFSLTIKKTWAGEFQIVLSKDQQSIKTAISPSLSGVATMLLPNVKNDLATEVAILESPSILMPIYQFVSSDNLNGKLEYEDWNKQLNIALKGDTSILRILYKDQKKDLILPVLEKLSFAYQEYSGRKEKRMQSLTRDYLVKQINIFKGKTSESIKKAQEFAISQDLIFISNIGAMQSLSQDLPIISQNQLSIKPSTSSLVPSNVGIENVRVSAANKIRKIDLQIKKIEELGDDVEQLKFIASTVPGLVEEKDGTIQQLADLESQLFRARSKYTDVDRTVISILERTDILINLLKKKAIGYLKAARLEAETNMESASRPKGVLLKYKNLIRNAERDELTLIKLEEQLRYLDLEASKNKDPWELITKPTLLSDPVAPRKRNIALLGLIFGFSFGVVISKLKEIKNKKIYNAESLETIFSAPIIQKVNLQNIDNNESNFIFLREFIKNNFDKKICLYPISQTDIEYLAKIKSNIINTKELEKSNNLKLISEGEFDVFIDSQERILVASIDNLNKDDLEKFNRNLKIFNINLSGIIILENS